MENGLSDSTRKNQAFRLSKVCIFVFTSLCKNCSASLYFGSVCSNPRNMKSKISASHLFSYLILILTSCFHRHSNYWQRYKKIKQQEVKLKQIQTRNKPHSFQQLKKPMILHFIKQCYEFSIICDFKSGLDAILKDLLKPRTLKV